MSGRKRDKASTPARGKEKDEGGAKDMDLSDSEGIQRPPSILKKSTIATKEMKSPDKKKTRKSKDGDMDGGSNKSKGGKPRGRSKSREGKAKADASKSRSPSKARSTSKTPKQRSTSISRSTAKEPNSAKKTPDSYAKKAAATPKSSAKKKPKKLKHSKFVSGVMEMPKSNSLRTDVYNKAMRMLTTCQSAYGAKTCRIANHKDPEGSPISMASQMPTLHVQVMNYFWFPPGNRMWNGNTIPVGATRKIEFSCLMEADVPIEDIVWTVGIDLIDLGIVLEVKTCQAIAHKSSMHFMYVNNKFNRAEFEASLMHQLKEFQESVYEFDPDCYLGRKQAAKKSIPTIAVKLDYPFNGPWEKAKKGQDTRYKRAFILEYALEDETYVETLMSEFKKAGKIKEYWGQHANYHHAPSKDTESVANTVKLKWHRICDTHSCTMLSTGIVMLSDVKDPDRKIKVDCWKPRPAGKMEYMSLRDVLHSIKVTGVEGKEIDVFHGICPAPGGGWEAGVASSIPQAHALATNIAAHTAGWILGYIKWKGWREDCCKLFLRQSFTSSGVTSAESSTWDKNTGVVSGAETMDETDLELQEIEHSWVDMSLLNPSKAEDSAVKEGEMAAFSWAEGGSVKTLTSGKQSEVASDADTSVVDSSDEDIESGEDKGSSGDDEEDEDSFGSARESEVEEEVVDLLDSDEESGDLEPMNLEEQLWTDIAELEDPVMELFHGNEEERDNIWTMLLGGVVTNEVLKLAKKFSKRKDRLHQLDFEMNELIDPETHEPADECEMMFMSLEQEYEQNKLLSRSLEVRLRDALRKLLAAQLPAAQDKVDEASAHIQNSVAFQDEVMQDTAQSDDAGRSSE